jgi:hypothetical protein
MPPRVKVKKLAVIVGLGTALGVWRARMLAINERERVRQQRPPAPEMTAR